MRKNKAFTLAEILIALTVIGVIAAITVPALIQNTQKQEYVTALKKTYSTLSQVTNRIIAEEGSPKCKDEAGNDLGGWGCSTQSLYEEYKKYLNLAQDCGTSIKCFEYKRNWKFLDGYNSWFDFNSNLFGRFILQDGTYVALERLSDRCTLNDWYSAKQCGKIHVDVNGDRKPNIYGRDIFYFALTEKGLYPAGYSSTSTSSCCTTSSLNSAGTNGVCCAAKVLRENAMNY